MLSHIETIYSRLAGDPVLGEIVEIFVAEIPDRIETLKTQSARGEWEELRRTAHQLKGALGSHGFDELSPVARRLEMAIRENKPEETLRSATAELISMCERMTAAPAEASGGTGAPEANG